MKQETDPLALPPGTRLGNYSVVSPLGKGGMGAVYVVERDGQRFAAKLSKKKLSELTPSQRDSMESRVRREVSILFAVSHPNVVRIHGADRWPDINGYLYIVTDLVEGEQLRRWQAVQSPSLRTLVETFLGIASGVHTLHKALFIHRDLKSENIIVDTAGKPVIIDFGIARQRNSYTLTETGSIVGTSDHLSPEFCRFLLERAATGEKYLYKATDDLHAVGFMLYEALAGRAPFEFQDGGNEYELLQTIMLTVPPSPRSLSSRVPAVLDALTMRLLEKDPEKRVQSGEELANALKDALGRADETWDAPYAPPTEQEAAAGAVVTVPARNRTERPAEKQQSPVVMLTKETPPPGVPVVAEPPIQYSAVAPDRPPTDPDVGGEGGFVSIEERRGERPPTASPNDAVPSILRANAELLGGPRAERGKRFAIVGAIATVAVIGVVLTLLLGRGSDSPQSLLSEFERNRQAQLAEPPPRTTGLAASLVTGTPPPETLARQVTPDIAVPAVREPSRDEAVALSQSEQPGRYSGPGFRAKKPAQESTGPRSLLRSSKLVASSRTAAQGAASSGLGIGRGEFLAAKLLVPLDPAVQGPVTAAMTKDALVDGRVAIPKGAVFVGTSRRGMGERVEISWDSFTVPGGSSTPFDGQAFGKDRKLGLPAIAIGGASAGGDAKGAAIHTAERIADRILGDGVVSDLGRGVVEAGGSTARRGVSSESDARYEVIPSGTPFLIFVETSL